MSKKLINLVYISPAQININGKNSKKQNADSIKKIRKSIEAFGFLVPLLVSKDNELICGFGRLQAAKEMELKEIPIIYADNLSPEEIRAFRIAENKIAESSEWDIEILSSEIKFLMDCSFEIDILGFSVGEIDYFLQFGDDITPAEKGRKNTVITSMKNLTKIPIIQIS